MGFRTPHRAQFVPDTSPKPLPVEPIHSREGQIRRILLEVVKWTGWLGLIAQNLLDVLS